MIKSIELNLTELCNLKCGFCPRGSEHNPYPNQNLNMSLDTVELIAKQAREFDKNVRFTLSGRGEPTLHPQFDKVIDIIKSYKFKIQLFTNGHRFDKFKSSIDKCDAVTYDVYSEDDTDFLTAILQLKDLKPRYKRIHVKTETGIVKHEWFNNEYILNAAENFLENRAGAIQEKYNDRFYLPIDTVGFSTEVALIGKDLRNASVRVSIVSTASSLERFCISFFRSSSN
jgi:MoaA/NifB/PqqE/SkfB family radical SAM enzyme